MHTLDSIMASVDLSDTLTVTERADSKINVKFIGENIDPVHNTAYAAAAAVCDTVKHGFDITVEKGIPIGAGFGGSSADGAAVLRAADLFYRLPKLGVDMRSLALSIGSDVPFMLTGGCCRVRGKGEDLYFFKNKLNLFGIGLMAGEVSTAQCYAEFDSLNPDKKLILTDNDELCNLLLDGKAEAVGHFGNSLYDAACKILPDVKSKVAELDGFGGKVCMTGSGGTVICWFTDVARFAECAQKLNGKNYRAFTIVPVGIVHEWISKE